MNGKEIFDNISSKAVLYVYPSVLKDYMISPWAIYFDRILPLDESPQPTPEDPDVISDYSIEFNYNSNSVIESAYITWPDKGGLEINHLNDEAVVAIHEEGYVVYILDASVEDDSLKVVFSKLPVGGYSVRVPEGFVTIGETGINSEIKFNIMVDVMTGIIDIDNDVTYHVYDLKGRLMLSANDNSDVRTLPKGIYIIVAGNRRFKISI